MLSKTVGYAMPPSKVEGVFQPSLVAYARERGINLVQVHIDKPLVEQGPFDCLVQKVYDDGWYAQLRDFKSKYPETVIIDSPDAIERIHNRVSMLEVVDHVPVPVQDSDTEAYSFGIPAIANSSDKSHEMSLVFSSKGLKKVKSPVVLQEFVNHGGVLFKVYVAGDHVKCVKRKSLPDFHVSDAAQTDY